MRAWSLRLRSGRGPAVRMNMMCLPAHRQNELQVLQHTGGRPPHLALAVGHGGEATLASLSDLAAVDAMVLLVEEVVERHLEYVGYLARIRMGGESGRDDAHHRRDLEAGAGTVEVDRPHHVDKMPRQPDLFLG